MSTLLSTISGQFTKAFVFSAGIPAVVFVLLNVILIMPMLPPDFWLVERLQPLEIEWRAVIGLFAAVVVGGLLHNLNIPLIQLYEGYLFEDTWLGRRMRSGQVQKLRKAEEDIRQLSGEYESIYAGHESLGRDSSNDHDVSERLADVESKLISLWSQRRVRFPGSEQFVTPTALGNVIVAFEHYSNTQYGMDSVTLWPHLIAVIDARYAAVVDDAKASLDFFINSSFLTAVLALEHAGVELYKTDHSSWASGVPACVVGVGLLAFLSFFCYRCSIDSAVGWGIHVKAAFDLYRHELLGKLGYSSAGSITQQVELWRSISRGMIYTGPEHPPPAQDLAGPAGTWVEAEPVEAEWDWRITKGVDAAGTRDEATVGPERVVCVIRVESANNQRAEGVSVVDAVPPGFDYLVGSSHIARDGEITAAEPVGSNPYRWDLASLDPGQSVTVTYLVLRRPGPSAV